MLSEGVNKGKISLEKLVEVCCYRPARQFGLAPRKGTLSIGSDADLVLIDLDKEAVAPPKAGLFKYRLFDYCRAQNKRLADINHAKRTYRRTGWKGGGGIYRRSDNILSNKYLAPGSSYQIQKETNSKRTSNIE